MSTSAMFPSAAPAAPTASPAPAAQVPAAQAPAPAQAPAAAPVVDPIAPVAPDAPKPEAAVIEGAPTVTVPTGTQAKLEAFFKGEDKSPEAMAKVLEGLEGEAKEKVQALLEGKLEGDVNFDEPEAPAPGDDDIPDDLLDKLPPQVSQFMQEMIAENEALKQNAITPEMEQVLMDPVIRARVEAMRTGGEIAVPSFTDALTSAGIAHQKLFDEIQDLFETAGKEPEARQLMSEAFELAVKDVVAKAQAATIAKMDTDYRNEQARTEMATFYDSGIEAVAKGLGANAPLLIDNGGQKEYNPDHPVAPFIRFLYEGQQDGTIPYAAVKKMGVEAMYQAWRVQQAGGVGNFMGDVRKSASDRIREMMKAGTTKALRDVAAKTPGSEGTSAAATIVINGVDIAKAVADKSGRYVDDIVRGNNLTTKQQDEIVDAMRKYELSLVR